MNVKIKADGVFCSFEKIYEQCYAGLYQNIGTSPEWIFTERKVGTGYLQWELPGEGWQQLSMVDPLLQLEIKNVLHTRKLNLIKKNLVDENLIHQLLSTPDDSYVYFKKSENENWDIKLTAWGYCYPVRVKTGAISGQITPEAIKQEITLRMMHDGKPMANKKFKLNDYDRCTNEKGELYIEELPVGYEFDVHVDGIHRHIKIQQGQDLEEFDLTQWATIEVKAVLNGEPYANATTNVIYGEKQFALQLDASGTATERIALSLNQDICEVKIDDAVLEKTLAFGNNLFNFALTKVITPPTVDTVVNIEVLLDGTPCIEKEVEVKYNGRFYPLKTNTSGKASITLQQNLDDNICEVICEGKTICKTLQAPETDFTFNLTPKVSEKKVVIKTTLNGEPYSNAKATIEYEGIVHTVITDAVGEAEINIKILKDNALCRVVCEDQELIKQLTEEVTLYAFDFQKEEENNALSEVIVTTTEKGKPRKDIKVDISYDGKMYTLTTDENGKATTTLPITNTQQSCNVIVLQHTLQKKLETPQTHFDFEIVESTPWWTYLLGVLGILLFVLLTLFTYGFCGGMMFA